VHDAGKEIKNALPQDARNGKENYMTINKLVNARRKMNVFMLW